MTHVAKDHISFDPENMYSRNPTMRQSLIDQVNAYEGPDGAVYAVIVNGPHTSRSDKRVHSTVDFYDADKKHLSRRHV
ncbi:hypothetical protein BS47DRAFT_1337916, partial [Hydnum rufescens UP504]